MKKVTWQISIYFLTFWEKKLKSQKTHFWKNWIFLTEWLINEKKLRFRFSKRHFWMFFDEQKKLNALFASDAEKDFCANQKKLKTSTSIRGSSHTGCFFEAKENFDVFQFLDVWPDPKISSQCVIFSPLLDWILLIYAHNKNFFFSEPKKFFKFVAGNSHSPSFTQKKKSRNILDWTISKG